MEAGGSWSQGGLQRVSPSMTKKTSWWWHGWALPPIPHDSEPSPGISCNSSWGGKEDKPSPTALWHYSQSRGFHTNPGLTCSETGFDSFTVTSQAPVCPVENRFLCYSPFNQLARRRTQPLSLVSFFSQSSFVSGTSLPFLFVGGDDGHPLTLSSPQEISVTLNHRERDWGFSSFPHRRSLKFSDKFAPTTLTGVQGLFNSFLCFVFVF